LTLDNYISDAYYVLEPTGGTMKTSDTIVELAAALVKAQGEIKDPIKGAENPAFSRGAKKALYADLAEVLSTIRPVFAKHGLAIIQAPSAEPGVVHVTTRIIHASGQWIEDTLSLPYNGTNLAHALGSAITYMRRYSAAAFAAIAQADDDGNASVETVPAIKIEHKEETLNQDQINEIDRLLIASGTNAEKVCTAYRVTAVSKLPVSAYDKIVARLATLAEEKAVQEGA
jgi:hypothetical protein